MSLDLKRQLVAQLVESSRLLRNYIRFLQQPLENLVADFRWNFPLFALGAEPLASHVCPICVVGAGCDRFVQTAYPGN